MPELIIFVGYQASGKSTYFKEKLAPSHKLVSKDLMGSNKTKQQAQQLENLLMRGESVVLDNTNLSIEERALAIPIGKKHNAKVICYWFTADFETCMARNAQRTGKSKVPVVAMYTGRKRFKEPTKGEGFDELYKIVDEGKLLPGDKVEVKPFTPIPVPPLEKAVSTKAKFEFPRSAYFLDKDGVIVDDSGYPFTIPKTTLIPGVEVALVKLAKLGVPIIVVSNQAWVAKGRLTLQEAEEVFVTLKKKVTDLGGRIDGTYFCPHPVKAGCECRKPAPGMLRQAAKEHNIDLSKSIMIGDMMTDIEAGFNAGVPTTVLVKGGKHLEKGNIQPTHIFKDLVEAVNTLCTPV